MVLAYTIINTRESDFLTKICQIQYVAKIVIFLSEKWDAPVHGVLV